MTGQSSQQPSDRPLSVAGFEAIAKTKLKQQVWDYYVSGSDEQTTIKRNRSSFDRLLLRPRVFRDVSVIDTSATLFGRKYLFPVGVSPSAMQKLVGGEGELDVARAIAARGTLMILSSNSTSKLEDVLDAAGGPDASFWFQIYISQDREKSSRLIKRAEKAGYKALAVTVDTPVLGNRYNERKTQLVLPKPLTLANLEDNDPTASSKPSLNRELLQALTREEAAQIQDAAKKRGLLNASDLTWHETIPWMKQQTNKMKIVVKGVMTAEDALLAIQHGADAIVVSNHGGRQLDGVASTLEALPEIVDVAKGRVPVLMDGGITRGSDVFKALALGADFCLVGRPALWGLAYDGQKGVEMVLDVLERELTRTMALCGARNLQEIEKGMLGVERRDGFGVAKL
ncbi:hypothetical protein LTS08_003729 [Lithohypha guttulata]|uniref:Oxidase FUB9 n=1 Tax=Lithohypha guttulata TaxID=1690604 RepID=A0AAN7SX94_9EURO|nr:hypothetical protein LTR51_001314 [Lithohypha guttulata]KAK5083535.1 hypothetical protein LTR05_006038 [Lithohypha guttulata]KAK5102927.1 hypothetical protein LTS08_003729 [Lithohypha guttulata]